MALWLLVASDLLGAAARLVFDLAAVGILCVALALLAGGAAAGQRWALADPGRREKWVPLWTLAAGLAAALLTVVASPSWHVEAFAGVSVHSLPDFLKAVFNAACVFGVLGSLLAVGCAGWDRLYVMGSVDAGRAVLRVGVPSLVLTVLLLLAGSPGPHVDPITRESTAPVLHFGAMLSYFTLLTIWALNGAGLARAIASRGRERLTLLLAAITPTFVAVIVAYALFLATVRGAEIPKLAAQAMLGANPVSPLSIGALTVRWVVVYLAVTLLIGLGAAAGLRLAPRPRHKLPPFQSRSRITGYARYTAAVPARSPELGEPQPDSEAVPGQLAAVAESVAPAEPLVARGHAVEPVTPPTLLERDFPRRSHFALLAAGATVATAYALLVPLNYRPLPWADAVQQFQAIRTYNLDIYRRADWVANLALFVPLGLAWSAALGVERVGAALRLVLGLTVATLLLGLTVGMEFAQLYFPPRTVSTNDIVAQGVGGLVGVAVWMLIGGRATKLARNLYSRRGSASAVAAMLQLYTLGVVVFAMLPLDFTLDPTLLQRKLQQASAALAFWSESGRDGMPALVRALRDLAMFLPVGVLMRLYAVRDGRRNSLAAAVVLAAAVAFAIEVGRFFTFSNHAEALMLLSRIAGGWLGAALAPRLVDRQSRPTLGLGWPGQVRTGVAFAVTVGVALVAAATLWKTLRFDAEPRITRFLLDHFWSPPFKHYYYAGEWQALVKLVHCAALFAPIGLAWRWAAHGPRARLRRGAGVAMALSVALGLAAEFGQAYLHRDPPRPIAQQSVGSDAPTAAEVDPARYIFDRLPDVTDVLAYTGGALAGWLVMSVLLGDRRPGEDAPTHDVG